MRTKQRLWITLAGNLSMGAIKHVAHRSAKSNYFRTWRCVVNLSQITNRKQVAKTVGGANDQQFDKQSKLTHDPERWEGGEV